jgi:protein-S-isoprenylcysteine O-methyltransferase Ste14
MRVPRSDTAAVWLPPPILAAVTLAVGLLLDWLFPVFVLTVLLGHSTRIALGLLLMTAGVALAILAERQFHRLGTPVPPWKPTQALATGGIYAHVRNPIYVGMIAAMAGLAVTLAGDWLLVLLVPMSLVLHHGVVRPEECYLEQKFGAAWRDYAARVPRYGWPA